MGLNCQGGVSWQLTTPAHWSRGAIPRSQPPHRHRELNEMVEMWVILAHVRLPTIGDRGGIFAKRKLKSQRGVRKAIFVICS